LKQEALLKALPMWWSKTTTPVVEQEKKEKSTDIILESCDNPEQRARSIIKIFGLADYGDYILYKLAHVMTVYRDWDRAIQKIENTQKTTAPQDRVLVKLYHSFPIALFLDKSVNRTLCLTCNITGGKSSSSLRAFIDQYETVGEEDRAAVATLLEELRILGYNPVVVQESSLGLAESPAP
jgi:hypothetical protein